MQLRSSSGIFNITSPGEVSARRLRRIKTEIRTALGNKCAFCTRRRNLEIDHIDGCTWIQRKLNPEHRWYRYRRELRAGIRLRLLCRKHNAALNQSVHGPIKDRITMIPVPNIEVGQVWQISKSKTHYDLFLGQGRAQLGVKFIICPGCKFSKSNNDWIVPVKICSDIPIDILLALSWIHSCCKLLD